jgi:hypothetical protein
MEEQLVLLAIVHVKEQMIGNWHLEDVNIIVWPFCIILNVPLVILISDAAYVIMIIVHLQWVVEVQLAQKMCIWDHSHLRYAVQD